MEHDSEIAIYKRRLNRQAPEVPEIARKFGDYGVTAKISYDGDFEHIAIGANREVLEYLEDNVLGQYEGFTEVEDNEPLSYLRSWTNLPSEDIIGLKNTGEVTLEEITERELTPAAAD